MGERRKRKSVLHMVDDNRKFSHPVDHNSWAGKERHSIKNRGRDHEFHGSREFMDPKSRDRLGWPTRESNGENGYCQEIFDGIERRKYKNYPENDRSDSHRYPRKDRSRSRSRSRSPRGRARSGSPGQDHKNQSHKWSDERSEPDKQFRICHDFSAGRCRKGSQCRFEHSRNTSHGHSSKDSHGKITGSDLRDDVPSYYHGEERRSLKKSRNAVPCREFLKAFCKWGDSCRFSHHLASDETADAGDPGDDGNSRYDNRLSIGLENECLSLRTQVGDIGMTGSFDKENIANKQEYNNVLHDFPLQNEVGNVNVQEQHTLLDHGVVENGIVTSFGSDVLDEIKKNDPTHLFPFPGQNQTSENVSVPGQFSVSNVTDVWQNVLSGGLDGPKTLAGAHLDLVNLQSGPRLDLHSQVKNHLLETQSGARLDSSTQVQDDQLETQLEACSYLHSQVNNPQLETQSGVLSDMQAQLQNHEEAVQTLTGLLESKVTFPIGFPQEPINPAENDPVTNDHGNNTEHYNQVQVKQMSPISTIDKGMDNPKVSYSENSKQKQEALSNPEVGKAVGEESKGVEKNKKTDENVASKDEKAMRLFKNSLIEFVKDILKPTWKEGRLSREVHKTIVKKVVDKVTGTVQPYHVPKTQDKVDQYLSFSKPKITKLVQAYVERSQKTDS